MFNQSSQTHPSQKSAWLLFLAIVLVAAGLRLWRINTLPPGLYFDEAYEGLEAWRIYSDPTYRPVFLKGDFGVVPLNAYANAVMFALFRFFGGEAGPVAMHVTAACFGILGVITLYGVARELQKLDRRKPSLSSAFPFFAAAVLAVMRWHLHFSRMGTEQIIVRLRGLARCGSCLQAGAPASGCILQGVALWSRPASMPTKQRGSSLFSWYWSLDYW